MNKEHLEIFKDFHNANFHDGDSHFDSEVYKKSNGDDFDDSFVQDCYDHFMFAWQHQQSKITLLEKQLREWKAKSMAAILNGFCNCGDPLQGVPTDKEGYTKLQCSNCNSVKYELWENRFKDNKSDSN